MWQFMADVNFARHCIVPEIPEPKEILQGKAFLVSGQKIYGEMPVRTHV